VPAKGSERSRRSPTLTYTDGPMSLSDGQQRFARPAQTLNWANQGRLHNPLPRGDLHESISHGSCAAFIPRICGAAPQPVSLLVTQERTRFTRAGANEVVQYKRLGGISMLPNEANQHPHLGTRGFGKIESNGALHTRNRDVRKAREAGAGVWRRRSEHHVIKCDGRTRLPHRSHGPASA